MHAAELAYLLGGISIALNLVASVLHGLCLASSGASSIESITVTLSAASCLVLLMLVVLWRKSIWLQPRDCWAKWRTVAYGLILAYLAISSGFTAGAVVWSTSKLEGLFAGFLLIDNPHNQCPSSLSQELVLQADQSSLKHKSATKEPALTIESGRQSVDRKTSCDSGPFANQPATSIASSHRYSGRTLYQPDSKNNSVDLQPPGLSMPSPDSNASRNLLETSPDERDSCSITTEERQGMRLFHGTQPEIKRCLDSLMLQPSSGTSSPAASTPKLEASRAPAPPKLHFPDESNIHPLFRSDSPSPPPTPLPGTNLHGLAVAGQTISVKTLNRMRSTNSLRPHGARSRSPLFERINQQGETTGDQKLNPCCENRGRLAEKTAIPGFLMAADVRQSIARYEKKYELNESPDES
ncbi:hypothetical protein KXW98_008640 [Aspergillus fumigatus]|uniref:Uncharacterized protein n=1 Tax=Aspergillus fumigatus (strain CBS 144.89 / FGSC A1163 / CEA10) TaxID=451804 RepID=B0Y3B2_ASPFC|nr:conserved hypothetical protein [Aspergillus fumigatus A1163]KAF4260336.1 hypothetical protein CNMCM8714_001162 [Aspergillus fumigatus]KAF4261020.1 hypothetical protein CNMCM8057_001967 [Aspergillus fumigatus]KAF4268655.1 hypothetical protein CNMCM8812_001741 [Aspergillus fumigatus]KAF4280342.1 hypothetical protein CNMCM8689_002195 [Aspergillus fumigatus]